jgi:acetolactate synthase-1/2/3 large subunit
MLPRDVGRIAPVTAAVVAPAPDPDAVARAAALLRGAHRPVVIGGGGANRAAALVQRLAETTGAAVLTTGNARGLLPDDHPLYAGTLLPFPAAQALITQADVVLAVGTEFSEVDVLYTGVELPQPAVLIRVDVDAAQLHVPFPADVALQGRADDVLTALNAALAGHGPVDADVEQATRRVEEIRTTVPWTGQSRSHAPWLDALAIALPADAVAALDSTQLAYTAHHYLPWSAPGRWLAPYGLGTLGPALPMGLGAAVAAPDTPVLVLAGDGGSLFTIAELATAADLDVPVVMVIWDNAGYGEIRDSFDRAGATRCGVETTAHDLVTVARGFGVHAVRVATPDELGREVAEAFRTRRPAVVVATEPGSAADRARS